MSELEKLANFAKMKHSTEDLVEKLAYENRVDVEVILDYIEKVAYENNVEEMEVLADMEQRRYVYYNKNDGKLTNRIKELTYGKENLDNYNNSYERLRRAKDNIYTRPSDPRNGDELAAARREEEDNGTKIVKRRRHVTAGVAAASLAAMGVGIGIGERDFKRTAEKNHKDFKRAAEKNHKDFEEFGRKAEERFKNFNKN